MTDIYIKYFFIMLTGFYFYTKLLNLKATAKAIICYAAVSVLVPFILCFSRTYFPYMNVVIIVFSIFCAAMWCWKTDINTALITVTLASGFSYVLFTIASFLLLPIIYTVFTFSDDRVMKTAYMAAIGGVQLLMVFLIFRLKRLQKGMPFLKSQRSNTFGMTTSVFILFCASCYNIRSKNDFIFIVPVFLTIFLGLMLYFWWRRRITQSYISKLKKRELEYLEDEIKKVKEDNERLSAIIHKDNKLIPALEFAVRDILTLLKNSGADSGLTERSKELLLQLEQLSGERKGILGEYETNGKSFARTGSVRLDALIKYMNGKAGAEGVNFDFALNGSVCYLIENVIDEGDLSTLVADFVENGIIACRHQEVRNVLLSIETEDGIYSINVYDSGMAFDRGIISKLGRSRVTTHGDSGGSGIGMMTAFEISRRYNASLYIDESVANGIYVKKVGMRFNGAGAFEVIE